MKKVLCMLLSVLLLLAVSVPAFANFGDDVIKVGINAQFKPFEYYDENENLCGFDIDLMNYIGERTGYKIEYVDMDFDNLFSSVISGDVDCAISAISVTRDRDNFIDFSREYLRTNNVTVENGDLQRKKGDDYAIVFKEGLKHAPYSDITNPTRDEQIYISVDNALRELSNDRTVEKLIEKYRLNQDVSGETEYTEYFDVRGDGSPAAKQDEKTSATSIPCSEWAKESIDKAIKLNIVPDGVNYAFTQPISREIFCEFIYNLIMSTNGSITTDGDIAPFTDTQNRKVHILNRAGIINGKSHTQFAPNDNLTREEGATIIIRMINKFIPMEATLMWYEYDDIAEISDWASDSVQTISNLGFMQGIGDNKFAPKHTYTVEQAIATLVRVYDATRKTYTYNTPLGTFETDKNGESYVNFGIECDAIIELVKDTDNFSQTQYVIDKPVKAITNLTSTMEISFDDFAEIFSGEWKLNDGKFEFTYDPETEIQMQDWKDYPTVGEWPNKTGKLDVVTFSTVDTIVVNGKEIEIKAQSGGKVYKSHITLYNGNLYIPVQMVAELVNFDIASLQVVS